jgi:hypothetical protein
VITTQNARKSPPENLQNSRNLTKFAKTPQKSSKRTKNKANKSRIERKQTQTPTNFRRFQAMQFRFLGIN